MTSLLVMHRPSVIQPSLHVRALPPSNAVNFVYSYVTHTPGDSEYSFQICTPAIRGTYGLQAKTIRGATEEELIFKVSQLLYEVTATVGPYSHFNCMDESVVWYT